MPADPTLLRNVAIIAHVDHGKTSLVDQLLYQSGQFREADLDKLAGPARGGERGLIMDSGDLERERGITILAKNCAVRYRSAQGPRGQGAKGPSDSAAPHSAPGALDPSAPLQEYKINLIDTPGHADFGGEVERVLKMADGVLLLVDAFEGPMPQTRFVLNKALQHGLKPVVVVNKIDRPDARPDDVVNEVFDLLVELDADDDALDFPVIYTSAKQGWASKDHEQRTDNMKVLFEAIIGHIPAPGQRVGGAAQQPDPSAPLQMLVTSLDYNDYVGRIAIGRVFAGTIRPGMPVAVLDREGQVSQQKVLQLLTFDGLSRTETEAVSAGDICAVVGLDPIGIGNTIADRDHPVALPTIPVDEPTLTMTFRVNDSPFAGREGKYVTSRQIWDRLQKELRSNVALRVERVVNSDEFQVSGRGLMHLGVLLENMRREGYELSAGKPRVIMKKDSDTGETLEPIERLVVECPSECQSAVMALIGDRRAEMLKMDTKSTGASTDSGHQEYIHMEFSVPARGLIGLRTKMLTATQGRAIMHHTLMGYEPMRGDIPGRQQGVIIATEPGTATAYSLDRLYDRGFFFVRPGDQVYEGQVVGEHCKDNDIVANLVINKKMSNMRTTSKDDAAQVRPAREMSLEACLEYIQDDELVEITPGAIRMRKRHLKESDRRKLTRTAKNAAAGV